MRVHALDKNHQVAVGHLDGLVQLGHGADAVQIDIGGILDAGIELRDHAEQALVAFQRIQQRERAFPADGQRQYAAREQDDIAHRQNR